MKVGFIGLGTMGRHMATNLARAGHDLTVHDLRREAGARVQAAVWTDAPRVVAEASEVVFTSLPGPAEVETVALGSNGLLEGMTTGKVYVDLTTNDPSLIRRIHQAFAARGIHVLDAPVSGGPRGAETRKLALWVGGDEAVFQRVKPVLDAIGDQAFYVGPIGAGSVARLVHNCAGYILQTALAEVFRLGVKAGVEPLRLFQALRHGHLGCRRTFDGLVDQFLPGKFEPPAFALRLAHKDVGLATALARTLGVPMRLANLTLVEMTAALNRGWGERDSRAAMLLQEERAGVAIKIPEDQVRAVRTNLGDVALQVEYPFSTV